MSCCLSLAHFLFLVLFLVGWFPLVDILQVESTLISEAYETLNLTSFSGDRSSIRVGPSHNLVASKGDE